MRDPVDIPFDRILKRSNDVLIRQIQLIDQGIERRCLAFPRRSADEDDPRRLMNQRFHHMRFFRRKAKIGERRDGITDGKNTKDHFVPLPVPAIRHGRKTNVFPQKREAPILGDQVVDVDFCICFINAADHQLIFLGKRNAAVTKFAIDAINDRRAVAIGRDMDIARAQRNALLDDLFTFLRLLGGDFHIILSARLLPGCRRRKVFIVMRHVSGVEVVVFAGEEMNPLDLRKLLLHDGKNDFRIKEVPLETGSNDRKSSGCFIKRKRHHEPFIHHGIIEHRKNTGRNVFRSESTGIFFNHEPHHPWTKQWLLQRLPPVFPFRPL